MILKRFIKSGKSVIILALVCVIVFMGLLIKTGVETQWMSEQENIKLRQYKQDIDSWKTCFEKIAIFEVDGEKVVKLSDVQSCGDSQ